MSRFGWAYVSDLLTSSVANGPTNSIQFNSGSQILSGSESFTFNPLTTTVTLTGTLIVDGTLFATEYQTTLVSSSIIYSSGSTKFGDDVADTHEFTGSIFGDAISGTIAEFTTITGSTITSTLITGSALVISASVVSASTYLGITGGGSTSPGGLDTHIQFNSGSTFSGSSNLTFNYSTNNLSLTGALLMSGTAYISEVDYIDFDVSASIPTYKEGRLFYDTNTFDLSYYTPVNGVQVEIGQQTVLRVKNSSGASITKGKLVHITGGVGNNPLIGTASWENDSNSANTLGMVMADINHNHFGYVILEGVLTGLNTDPARFTAGQLVYLSSSGDYTATTPVAPKHSVRIGEVVRAHATVGSIFVRIDNGYELDELHNVLITSPANADLLVYNSGSAVWENTKILSGSYTITGTLTAGAVSAASNIISTGGILSASTGVQTAGAITAVGVISSSTGFQTANSITAGTNITSTGGTISASVGFQTAGTVTSVGNITSTGGTLSASVGVQSGGTITSINNITSTGGTVSASVGFQTAGTVTAASGLIITGSSFVQSLSSSAQIQATSFRGDGLNITGIQGTNVAGVGNNWSVQVKNASDGNLTGSGAMTLSQSATVNLLILSSSGFIASSRTRTSSVTITDGDHYLFMSGTALTATLGTSTTGRELVIYNYGNSNVYVTGSGILNIYSQTGTPLANLTISLNPRSLTFVYLSDTTSWHVI